MKVKIMLDEGAICPTRAHENDAGLDLYSRESCVIGSFDSGIFNTGVHVEIPVGYVGFIKSKSGLMVKSDITADGTIDAGYTGSIIVIFPLTVDLKCTMGQHEYGTDTVEVGLLTLEQYGEFYDIIPLIEDDWWCLATPWKTPSRSPYTHFTNSVWIVYTNGGWRRNLYGDSYGVRPALNLNPFLSVSYEDDGVFGDSESWDSYIKYLHKWAVEHDDAKFAGCVPATFQEWQDCENEEGDDE